MHFLARAFQIRREQDQKECNTKKLADCLFKRNLRVLEKASFVSFVARCFLLLVVLTDMRKFILEINLTVVWSVENHFLRKQS